MEEKKNNAMEKVENAIAYANGENVDTKRMQDVPTDHLTLREKSKMERERARNIRFKERMRLKEQKLLARREEKRQKQQRQQKCNNC